VARACTTIATALAVLGCEDGAKWLVFGDMGELGAHARVLHERAGKIAAEAGVERLFTIGGLAQYAHAEFGRRATHYDDQSDLIEALKAALGHCQQPTTVLIKGSRVMALDRVADALANDGAEAC
jgi:UDP-N-acetylmuramoyl-tripeptide--D-alanyl-D-alanine ligase